MGKPTVFAGVEETFLPWRTRLENYVINTYPEMREVLEWAEDHETQIDDMSLVPFYDPNDPDYVEDLEQKQGELFTGTAAALREGGLRHRHQQQQR